MPNVKAAPPPPPEDSDPEISSEGGVFDPETMKSLSVNHRRRVYAMRALSQTYRSLRAAYLQKLADLQRAQLAEAQTLYDRRRDIVAGAPLTPEEERAVAAIAEKESTVEELPSEDETEKAPVTDAPAGTTPPAAAAVKKRVGFQTSASKEDDAPEGIPDFWLTALQNCEATASNIEPRDEEALRKLTDITLSYPDNDPRKGFTLSFKFAPNEFFTNPVLTKTYLFDREGDAALSFEDVLDKIVGCDILWTSPAKKLTVEIKQRKQRHKSGKGTRIVTREEDVPSFFHFFKSPEDRAQGAKDSKDDDDEEDEDDIEEEMYEDYSVGDCIAKELIPRAAYYYTGKSIDDFAASLDFNGDDDDDDDEDEDEDDEEEDEAPPPRRGKGKSAGRGGAGAQGCPQQ